MPIYSKNKFLIPKAKLKIVEKKDVFGLLDKSQETKLAIVCAQAGSGKTAAVSSWIEARNLEDSIIWISFDERDNKPEIFVKCLMEAAGRFLGNNRLEKADMSMEYLLNILSDSNKNITFVFDDFHCITDNEILKEVKYFIDSIGENIHLIITSRSKLNLNIAKLRLNGEVIEIGKNDFNFSLEETAEFVQGNTKLELPEKIIKQLWEKTEGWIAGIQMALFSIKEKKDIGEFEEKFSGCSSYLQDYFYEEVYNRQTREIKEFFLKTSILEDLTAELCNAASERNDSQQILEYLYDNNLFIDKLDYDGRTYKYQRLFKEFLICRAEGANVEAFYEAGSRAAKWYRDNGFLNNAINQYIGIGNFEPVVGLVESECIKMIFRGGHQEVMRWLENIPEDIIIKNPRLSIARMFLYISDDISYAKYREFAIRALNGHNEDEYKKECLGVMLIAEGDRNVIRSEYKKSLESYKNAQTMLEGSIFYDIVINLKFGTAYFYLKDFEKEKEHFDKAMLQSQAYLDDMLYIMANRTVLFAKMLRRQLNECENICSICINGKINKNIKKSPLMSVFYIGLALVYLERNDIERADEFVKKGLELIENDKKPFQYYYTMFAGLYVYAGVLLEKGSKAELDRICTHMEELSQTHFDERVPDIYFLNKAENYIDAFRIERFMEAGKTSLVGKYISKMDFKDPDEIVLFCRSLVDKGKSDDALMLLNKVISEGKDKNGYAELKAVVLRAEIFSQDDQYENATRDFKEALTKGYKDGFVRIFSYSNIKTSKMLIKTIRGMKFNKDYYKMGEYLNKIASLYADEENTEIISRREKEVLELIENGARNSDIAKELFITESTVKSHILNIYSKLGVNNRIQAVAKAKEMGII